MCPYVKTFYVNYVSKDEVGAKKTGRGFEERKQHPV
jgi:hypothetical protein